MNKDMHFLRNKNKNLELEYTEVTKIFTELRVKKWYIFVTSIVFPLFVLLVLVFKLQSYTTSVLINLNASKESGSLSNVLSKVSPILNSDDSSNDQQTAIIKSYAVLAPVVSSLKLDIVAEAKVFPILGKLFYYKFTDTGETKDGIANPFLGMSSYAWGGESIKINKFNVPDSMKNKKFLLTYSGENKFTLKDSFGDKIISGEINKDYEYKYYKNSVIINVGEIQARQGVTFKLTQLTIDEAIENILQNLNIANAGKKADLITLTFKGNNPNKIATILNSIANSAVKQDVSQKQEQAKKTLEFLRQHEPKVRIDLSSAESVLHDYRAKSGNVALDQETKITMDNIAFLQSQISQLLIQKGQIEQKFTDKSLQIKDVNTTLAKLTQEKEKFEKKLKELPNADQIALNLMRNVEIQNQIYVNLVEKIQQFELLEAGTVSDLSILSSAYIPLKSSDPPISLVLIMAFVFGGILSSGFIIIRKLMLVGIENSDFIEKKYCIPCLANLNSSKIQNKQVVDFEKSKIKHLNFLAEIDSYDLTVESLRSLRTNLSFQFQDHYNQIVVFSSPTPNSGKSFLSANFAHILTEAGKKVLLIDGDLRRGSLLQYFDKNSYPNGLSDVLMNKFKPEEVIQNTRIKNLDFIPRGKYYEKITSMIQTGNIEILLKNLTLKYDYIVIDTPPILSVSDSIYFGKNSTILIMVFAYESHCDKEIEESIKKYDTSKIHINGFVFNKVEERQSHFGSKYSYTYSCRFNESKS